MYRPVLPTDGQNIARLRRSKERTYYDNNIRRVILCTKCPAVVAMLLFLWNGEKLNNHNFFPHQTYLHPNFQDLCSTKIFSKAYLVNCRHERDTGINIWWILSILNFSHKNFFFWSYFAYHVHNIFLENRNIESYVLSITLPLSNWLLRLYFTCHRVVKKRLDESKLCVFEWISEN